jgi:hypothetical protein
MVYCLKNITKCPYCKLQVDIKDLNSHIEEAAGNKEDLVNSVQTNNLEVLKRVHVHGGDITSYRVPTEQDASLMHIAVKANQIEVVDYLILM